MASHRGNSGSSVVSSYFCVEENHEAVDGSDWSGSGSLRFLKADESPRIKG